MINSRYGRVALACGLAFTLSGCADGGIYEIRQWMEEVKRNTKVSVEPVSEPKRFVPFAYEQMDAPDPFSPLKLEIAFAKAKATASASGVRAPDMNRRRELLENYPLDTIKMVGMLRKQGLTFGILNIDGNVYHAKIGNYVGTNFGIVTDISETEVKIKEVVQDASGEWVEREAKLELQEAQK